MTDLSLAARNFLAQQSSVTSLLGSDGVWGSWIFEDSPQVVIENTQKVMIVLTEDNGWAAPNDYNTARFPQLIVDIWADPTRNSDLSVKRQDAKTKISAVYKAVDKFLHMVNKSQPGGASVMWGTAAQISARTGIRIDGCVRSGEPDFNPTFDNKGGYMARIVYNVSI